MKRLNLFFSLLLLVVSLQLQIAFGQEYEKVWSDEFNGTKLDTSIWKYELGGGANNELQYYTNRDTNSYVKDGKLTIRALKENFGGKNYTSARIVTSGKFNFKYGKVEAYMKIPYGQGIWPAFWMLGESIGQVGWPNCGEIDIMELIGGAGSRDRTIYSTLHWGPIATNGGHPSYGQSYSLPSGKFNDKYHLISTVWEDKVLRTYCDSVLFYTIDLSPTGLNAFDANFFILLNLAVGGDWPGNPDGTTVFPQTYEIDYVRVYKSKGTLNIEGNKEVYPSDSLVKYSVLGASDWTYDWILPDGATSVGTSDSSVIFVNWGCSDATIKCHVKGSIIDDTVGFDVKIKQPVISSPLFFNDNENGLKFSLPDLHGTSYNWSVPTDATITDGQGTSSILVNWGTTSDTVKVETQNSCGTSSYSKLLFPYGQYSYPDPYNPHKIPGTIQSTDYDYGGEGVAYHDNEIDNQGPGPRQDEGVDTENNDGGSNVGWINNGEWLEFTVDVEETREYKIEVRVATQNTTGISPLNIYFNGENRTGNITVPTTGSWSVFKTISVAPVQINVTDTLMKLDFGGGGYNAGNIMISNYIPSSIQSSSISRDICIYPNPASEIINVDTQTNMSEVRIMDITGNLLMVIKEGSSQNYKIQTIGLAPGIYIVKAIIIDGGICSGKFIKD